MRYEYYLTQATPNTHTHQLRKNKSALAYIILLYASHYQLTSCNMLVTTFSCQPKHNPLTKKQKGIVVSPAIRFTFAATS